MKAKRGFTLVEILIVVVILGILAAIVIPQFTGASTEAKLSSLVSDLQTIRSQIELYKLQHNEQLPGAAASGESFEEALTEQTTVDGALFVEGSGDKAYGPYMQKLPTNQFVDLATVNVALGAAPLGNDDWGWAFNLTTGEFYPNYVDADGDGASDEGDADESTY